jgi:RNA polymerase sigma-70 factor (ECF subfamily)
MALKVSKIRDPVEVNDQTLIAACLEGRTDAFGTLVRKYQDRLFRTMIALVGSREDAQDVVQDTFVRAFQNLGSYRSGAAFYTWLYRIAVNAAFSRSRRRRPKLSVDHHREQTGADPADVREGSNPQENLERRERVRQVHDALARLSEEHRTVLVLKELEGYRYEEIAAILKCPVGTVRSRLHRARAELREILSSMLDGEPVG